MPGSTFFRRLGGVLLAALSFVLHAEPLHPDPAWQQGKLTNGFRWQILTTPQRPSDSIQLRLVVNSGSLSEKPQQAGFSHLLARLALVHNNALTPEQQRLLWQQVMEQPHSLPPVLTSYQFTQYNLSLPVNQPEILGQGLRWLAATAGEMQFTPQIISTAQQASDPTSQFPGNPNQAWWQLRIKNSALQHHDPSLSPAGAVDPQQLADFYHRWYTPDAMTLYITGNVDGRLVVEQVNKAFNQLTRKRSQPAQMATLAPLTTPAIDLTDSNLTRSRLSLVWDTPWTKINDSQTLEHFWLEGLARDALNGWLASNRSSQEKGSTALSAGCQVFYTRGECRLNLDVPSSELEQKFTQLTKQLVTLRDKGLPLQSYSALMAAKNMELKRLFSAYARTPTSQLMARKLRTEHNGIIDMAPEQYQRLRQQFLAGLTPEILNHALQQLVTQPVTLVLAQPTDKGQLTASQLRAQYDRALINPAQAAKL